MSFVQCSRVSDAGNSTKALGHSIRSVDSIRDDMAIGLCSCCSKPGSHSSWMGRFRVAVSRRISPYRCTCHLMFVASERIGNQTKVLFLANVRRSNRELRKCTQSILCAPGIAGVNHGPWGEGELVYRVSFIKNRDNESRSPRAFHVIHPKPVDSDGLNGLVTIAVKDLIYLVSKDLFRPIQRHHREVP